MSNPEASPRLIRIGRISRPHGLKGGVRVMLDHPESGTLASRVRIFLQSADGVNLEYSIEAVRPLGRRAVWLKLAGIDSCESAEELRAHSILIAETDLPSISANEFYDFQALGCEVVTTDGQLLGTVKEIFGTAANDILVVRSGHQELLVPVIADVIKQMDFDARRITIEAVPGLLA